MQSQIYLTLWPALFPASSKGTGHSWGQPSVCGMDEGCQLSVSSFLSQLWADLENHGQIPGRV